MDDLLNKELDDYDPEYYEQNLSSLENDFSLDEGKDLNYDDNITITQMDQYLKMTTTPMDPVSHQEEPYQYQNYKVPSLGMKIEHSPIQKGPKDESQKYISEIDDLNESLRSLKEENKNLKAENVALCSELKEK